MSQKSFSAVTFEDMEFRKKSFAALVLAGGILFLAALISRYFPINRLNNLYIWLGMAGGLLVVVSQLARHLYGPYPMGSLHNACMNGDLKKVKKLLEKGTEVNKTDREMMTPLMRACIGGNGDVVGVLIKAGADTNLRTWMDRTALMLTLSIDAAQVMIKNGVDVNKASIDGWTALGFTLLGGRDEISRFLLENGAEPNVIHEDGSTPVFAASTLVGLESVIAKGGDPFHVMKDGTTTLMAASVVSEPEIIQKFLDLGVKPNQVNKDEMTALDFAKKYKNKPAIQLLQKIK